MVLGEDVTVTTASAANRNVENALQAKDLQNWRNRTSRNSIDTDGKALLISLKYSITKSYNQSDYYK
jgi:hypothetical protein